MEFDDSEKKKMVHVQQIYRFETNFELIVNCALYFHASHHIIDSVLFDLSCGLFIQFTTFSRFFFFSASLFVVVTCLVSFIISHKDEHVVLAAFKYVSFFLCICLQFSSLQFCPCFFSPSYSHFEYINEYIYMF